MKCFVDMLSSTSGKANTDPKKMDLADADSTGKSQVISPAGSEAGYLRPGFDRPVPSGQYSS